MANEKKEFNLDLLTIKQSKDIKDLVELDKELKALITQYDQQNAVIDSINQIIKEIKSGNINEIHEIIGGTLVLPTKDMKKVTDELVKKRENIKDAKIGIKGQVEHREDHLNELYSKIHEFVEKKLLKAGLIDKPAEEK